MADDEVNLIKRIVTSKKFYLGVVIGAVIVWAIMFGDTTYFLGLFDRFFPSLPFLGVCFRVLYAFPYAICLSL